MLADPDSTMVRRAYARWAPVYDAVCGPVFLNARRAATAAAKRTGPRILEIGVGTGLAFADYDARFEVTGIDVSEPMIAKARARLAASRHPWVRELRVMDAERLAFADSRFDAVVAQFVITLVANPERVLDECARVLAPGGEIILVNHYRSQLPIAAKIEEGVARYVRPLGLRPEFPLARIEDWAAAHGGVTVVERRKIKPFRAFTLVRIKKASSPPAVEMMGWSMAASHHQAA
jgi:phosphatidylethanolamine/phosphatidyl-N-methylethanolamine N-methyltransferase